MANALEAATTDADKKLISQLFKFVITDVETTGPTADAVGAETDGFENGSSTVIPNENSTIDYATGVQHVVKFGSQYSKNDFRGEIYNQADHFRTGKYTDWASLSYGAAVELDPVADTDIDGDGYLTYVPSKTEYDVEFAKPGSYTVYFLYHDKKNTALNNKWTEKTASVKVTNSLTAPREALI